MKDYISRLEKKESDIIEIGKKLFEVNKSIYHFDTYCIAQLNRSINLINGFCKLAQNDNFIAAFSLVRLHLDTLQRIFAFQLIDKNIDEIVKEILNGKQINEYQDRNSKKKLTDSELSKKLSELDGFGWVKDIYLAGNGFVHFSDKHIVSSMIKDYTAGTLKLTISRGSPYINNDDKEGACICMEKITDGIIFFINSWIEHKQTYT